MDKVIRDGAVRVGVDLAKKAIQVHAVGASGRTVTARSMSREKFIAWAVQLPRGCVVAMEACSGAHHWGRRLQAVGVEVRLIAAHLVSPYRMEGRGGKNDANDAAAICEAAARPQMRFVPVKRLEQQAVLVVHRLREGYKVERTACINRIRGLLAEFGLVFSRSPEQLRERLAETLEDPSNELPALARLAIDRARAQWVELDAHIAWCDQQIVEHARKDEQARAAQQLMGIGPIGASALVATIDNFKQFKSGDQLSAWLGVVPSQNSTGGKAKLGRITKRGDDYLRTLLIQGAKSAVMTAHKRKDRISQWLVQLTERVGWQKAAVALANKNARILWSVLTKGVRFNADHCPIRPAAPVAA